MRRFVLRATALGAIYLLVLTSLDPGDIAIAVVLGVLGALAVQPLEAAHTHAGFVASTREIVLTAGEVVTGAWRVVRFCLTDSDRPGYVELPRGGRSRADVARWGILTGESPDDIVVDVDEERDVLILHVVDVSDAEAIRERHRIHHPAPGSER